MLAKELCEKLQIGPERLEAWVKEGLPCSGRGKRRTFDPWAVRRWLLEAGKAVAAEPPSRGGSSSKSGAVAKTFPELARHFRVSLRTAYNWAAMGCPRNADQSFDLEAVARWRLATSDAESPEAAQHRTERLRIAAEREQLGLDELRGRLVDVEVIQGIVERHIAEARAQLQQIPDLVLVVLPAEIEKQAVRQQVDELVSQACAALATTLDDLAEEIERGKTDEDGGG